MAQSELLDKLQSMVDESDESVLLTFLAIAKEKVLARLYPFDASKRDVPARYIPYQLEIAAYLLNKRGAEGETTHDENGIRRVYENADVPASLLKQIIPYGGVFL